MSKKAHSISSLLVSLFFLSSIPVCRRKRKKRKGSNYSGFFFPLQIKQVMKKNKSNGSSVIIKVILLFLTSFILAILFIIFLFISSPPSLQTLITNQITSSLQSNPYFDSINTNVFLFQFILTLTIGFFGPFVIYYRHRKKSMKELKKIIPKLQYLDSGRVDTLERFSHYVARQMGFGDTKECSKMSRLAEEYLRKCKGCEGDIYGYFSKEEDADLLYVKLVEEFERCILSYFAFNWSQATLMISQILSVDSEPKGRLRNMILAATRKLRFERVTKDLKVARVFSTLVEEMKAIRGPSNDDSQCTDVMIPAAHSERSPVLLLMGGGMGAGKSTVLKDILKESFWSDAAGNAVVVEADAFKETDVIYRALSSRGHHDMLQTAELVHQSSTDAASSLLVTALNEGRDVIMDGTLSWEPFVYQTITMARNVHRRRYRMGTGYKVGEDGTITESYWEQIKEPELEKGNKESRKKKPYRIELVGVVCDAYIAVVRGMRRAIMMGRAVRVQSQLRSHKRFAQAFPRYCQLVDNARLYCTNDMGAAPQLIGWKDGDNNLLLDPQRVNCLSTLSMLNEEADSVYELYDQNDEELDQVEAGSSVWRHIVLSSSRNRVQHELKIAIQKVEKQLEELETDS